MVAGPQAPRSLATAVGGAMSCRLVPGARLLLAHINAPSGCLTGTDHRSTNPPLISFAENAGDWRQGGRCPIVRRWRMPSQGLHLSRSN
jgi:hypothetical protein